MFNLINADIYRLIRKKNTYVFHALMLGVFFLYIIVLMADSQKFQPKILEESIKLSMILSMLIVSNHVLINVYTDDVSSSAINYLIPKIGSKTKYIFSKFVVCCIYTFFTYLVLSIMFMGGVYFLSNGFRGETSAYLSVIKNIPQMLIITYIVVIINIMIGTLFLYYKNSVIAASVVTSILSMYIFDQVVLLLRTVVKPLDFIVPFLINTQYTTIFEKVGTYNINVYYLSAFAHVIILFVIQYFLIKRRQVDGV